MKKVQMSSLRKKPALFALLRILTVSAGTAVLFNRRKTIASFFKRQGVVIATIYGVLFSLIALVFRLLMGLMTLLQQTGGPK
jgi:hypothetical protein